MPMARTLLASLAIVAIGATALGIATDGLHAFTSEAARRMEVREHPRSIPARLPLQTDAGAHIDFQELHGRWLLVNFIYTRCPTFCTVLGSEFAQLQRQLDVPLRQGQVRLLSISFDPAHDTPGQLAGYKRRFGDGGTGWIAARPVGARSLAALKQAFGVVAVPDGLGGYVHNAAIEVVDPQGRLVAVLDFDDPQAAAEYVRARLAQ